MATRLYCLMVLIAALLIAVQTLSIAEQGDISEIRLNLKTSINDATRQPRAIQSTPDQRITVLAKQKLSGSFPRQRDPQLSPRSLLVVGLDKYGEEIWRTVMADPRLIRAEIFDPNGNILISKEIYQRDVEFSVVLPADPYIHWLRIYQSKWTGTRFDLQVIGDTELH